MRGVVRLLAPRSYMDRQRRAGLLFVLPALAYFSLVFLVPLVESVIGSFYRTVPGGASRFVGFRLYERVFTDPTFWQAVAEHGQPAPPVGPRHGGRWRSPWRWASTAW